LVNVTVTIEGDIEEVVAAIRRMAGSGEIANHTGENAPAAPVEAPPAPTVSAMHVDPGEDVQADGPSPAQEVVQVSLADWNISYVNTFWRTLSETARQAMLRVSRSPGHTQRRAQLMHTLNLSQRELSGSLSSQGHSMNRLKRRRGDVELPRPLIYDREADAYILDANFATALREMGIN
jgi:hypothetical protein